MLRHNKQQGSGRFQHICAATGVSQLRKCATVCTRDFAHLALALLSRFRRHVPGCPTNVSELSQGSKGPFRSDILRYHSLNDSADRILYCRHLLKNAHLSMSAVPLFACKLLASALSCHTGAVVAGVPLEHCAALQLGAHHARLPDVTSMGSGSSTWTSAASAVAPSSPDAAEAAAPVSSLSGVHRGTGWTKMETSPASRAPSCPAVIISARVFMTRQQPSRQTAQHTSAHMGWGC